MNEKDEAKARTAADNMIRDLLTRQPELLKVGSISKESGKAVGEFIAALRAHLIEMYQQKPS